VHSVSLRPGHGDDLLLFLHSEEESP